MKRSMVVLLAALALVPGCKKRPLYAEVPAGPLSGRTGAVLVFTSSAVDPGGNEVSVRFDWGDGDTSDWSGWLAGSVAVTESHSWSSSDTFSVRAQARNTSGVVSEWSQAFAVTIVDVWTQTFGGTSDEEGFAATQSADGGYILTGHTYSFGAGSGDIYVVKTSAAGKELWTKTFGSTGYDGAYAMLPGPDGGCVVAGTSFYDGVGYSDACLLRLDASGNVIGSASFGWTGADMARSVQPTSDGAYVIAGQTTSFGTGQEDVYLIKTHSDGSQDWYQTFGGPYKDIGYSVQQTSDGGYVITGQTDPDGDGVTDIYLVKTDTAGRKAWDKTFDLGGHDYGYSVEIASDGGYVVAGQVEQGAGGSYAYLLKTDAEGNKIWDKTYGISGGEMARSIRRTGDGGFIVVGSTSSTGAGSYDVYLIKTDASGDTLWTRTIGGPDSDVGYSVRLANDGGYVIAGTTSSCGAGGSDAWLIKTDAQGKVEGE